jgi:hypothetical protein
MRNFDCSPKRFAFCRCTLGNSPGLQVKLDRFAKTRAGALDISSLGSDAQLRAARDVPSIFFSNERGESVSHNPMLTDVQSAGKVQQFPALRSH